MSPSLSTRVPVVIWAGELQRHEHGVRVGLVVGERTAVREPETLIELVRRRESDVRAGFETEPPIATPFCFGNDVSQNCAACASPTRRPWRTHRLHFAMRRGELLERAATQQHGVVPYRPERDVR